MPPTKGTPACTLALPVQVRFGYLLKSTVPVGVDRVLEAVETTTLFRTDEPIADAVVVASDEFNIVVTRVGGSAANALEKTANTARTAIAPRIV